MALDLLHMIYINNTGWPLKTLEKINPVQSSAIQYNLKYNFSASIIMKLKVPVYSMQSEVIFQSIFKYFQVHFSSSTNTQLFHATCQI